MPKPGPLRSQIVLTAAIFTLLLMAVNNRYLLITVPLNIAFAIEVEFGTFTWYFDAFVDFYFICDIFFNFRTPYELAPKAIDRRSLSDLLDCGYVQAVILYLRRLVFIHRILIKR